MWREKVYNGTLRTPSTNNMLTGEYLYKLVDWLTQNVNSNQQTKISESRDVNCILHGLYLGDEWTAKDKRFLARHEFTHVLNAAEGPEYLSQVNTNADYYKDVNITYMGIPGSDRPSWNIAAYFDRTSKFIDDALRSGGKVLVHCVVGISRSATLVIAYLMLYRHMNAAEALEYTFKRRRVFPNEGFLRQLAHFNSELFGPYKFSRRLYTH